jgi:hypothetical protein
MNKLIYLEQEYDKAKGDLKALYKLRAEILSQEFNNVECIEFNVLLELLKRVNRNIKFLVDKV